MKKIILLFLVTSSIYSQKGLLKDEITFRYDDDIYQNIAKDSVKVLYDRQKKYYTENKSEIDRTFYENAISLKYKFEDLDYFIIPQYRLYREAEKEYNCKNQIEHFIVFDEPSKYFKALIKIKDTFVGNVSIPNFIFEYQRIYTPDVFTIFLRSQYVDSYLNEFTVHSMANYQIIEERHDNFFFELYGLDNVVFEIEHKSGLLYANYFGMFIDEIKVPRMPANDFIRKYVGEKVIIELAKGNYNDIDLIGSVVEFKASEGSDYDDGNLVLKVIR